MELLLQIYLFIEGKIIGINNYSVSGYIHMAKIANKHNKTKHLLSSLNDPPPRIVLPLVVRGRSFSLPLGTIKIMFPLENTS